MTDTLAPPMYNRIDDERINVFHAMRCRKELLPVDAHHLI